MKKKIITLFTSLDKKAKLVLKHGLQFCFILCIVSVLVLLAYETIVQMPFLFDFGIALFRLSTIFSIEFIICAIAADTIKKQIT